MTAVMAEKRYPVQHIEAAGRELAVNVFIVGGAGVKAFSEYDRPCAAAEDNAVTLDEASDIFGRAARVQVVKQLVGIPAADE